MCAGITYVILIPHLRSIIKTPPIKGYPRRRTKRFASICIVRTAKLWNSFPDKYILPHFSLRVNRFLLRQACYIVDRMSKASQLSIIKIEPAAMIQTELRRGLINDSFCYKIVMGKM